MAKIINIDFNKNFTIDADIEKEMNSIIGIVGKNIIEEEERSSIVNQNRLKQIEFAYRAVKCMITSGDVNISYYLHKPFKSMGYISIVGKNITFNHPEWFIEISKCASNVEFFVRNDDTVQINIGFHGLTM